MNSNSSLIMTSSFLMNRCRRRKQIRFLRRCFGRGSSILQTRNLRGLVVFNQNRLPLLFPGRESRKIVAAIGSQGNSRQGGGAFESLCLTN